MTDPTPEYRGTRDPRFDALAPTGYSLHSASTAPRQITGLDRARAALAGGGLRVSAEQLQRAFALADLTAQSNRWDVGKEFIYAITAVTLATPDQWLQAARELREREGER